MRTRNLLGASVATLLLLLAGCASQTPSTTATGSPSSSAPAAPPLQEPFNSVLARWNFYRTSAGVPPIAADPVLNEAALHHAKYLVNNHLDAGDAVITEGRMMEHGWDAGAHSESIGNQWYTEDGAKWAEYATIIRGKAPVTDGAALVDEQATRTDALAVLDPQLAAVGFGLFCSTDDCAGVIIYRVGLSKSQFLALYEGNAMDWNGMLGSMPFTIARLRKPIEFPASGMQFPSRAFRGGDYPNPLTSCSGYTAPTGVPIILQLGAPIYGDNVKLSSSSLSENGTPVETCGFDATTYANPDGYQQSRSRDVLRAYGAVMMIPKNPLQPGHTYTVSMVADSQPYTWTFSVAPNAK